MTRQKIIFRADGNSKIGLGHVSRCLALAEVLSTEHDTCFAIQEPDDSLYNNIKKTVSEIVVLANSDPATLSFQSELKAHLTGTEIIVLDGYHFSTTYEANLKKLSRAVVSIDDIPSRHFVSDVVFNFCGGIPVTNYSKEFYTQLRLGLEYVFLRSPFLRNTTEKKFNDLLFLNMGGADPDNNTFKILNELISSGYSGEIEVVIGNSYAHKASLESLREKRDSIFINQGLTAEEMFSRMSKCALAIVPPSTVALEFLSTGGLAFLHQTADNQALQKDYLINSKLAFDYATFKSTELSQLELLFQDYISLQKSVFDLSSLERVKKVFSDLETSCQLFLRKATINDCQQCYEWANDPEIRKHSYSTEQIPWEDHVKWFNRKMTDPNCFYFVAEIENNSVGQIRFDFVEDENAFQISFSIDQRWRGKGLASSLLTKGIQSLNLTVAPINIVAYAKKSNPASVKAFQRAGFNTFLTKNYTDSFKFELSVTPI